MPPKKTTTTTTVTTRTQKKGRQAPNPESRNSQRKARRRNRGAPASYAVAEPRKTGKMKLTHVEKGSDIVYSFSVAGSGPTVATTTASFYVNPLTLLSGTRLQVFATLFQKYRFTKFELVWEPELSVTFSGRVFSYYLANPELEYTYTGTRLLQKLTQNPSYLGPCYKPGRYSIPPSAMQNAKGQKYVIDPENSDELIDCYAGRLFFGFDGPATPNTTYGTWRLNWAIELYDAISEPTLNASVVQFLSDDQPSQTHPWGTSVSSVVFGDPGLAYLTPGGATSILSFPEDGNYFVEIHYPSTTGGAGLTSSSTIQTTPGGIPGGAATNVLYESAQTGKRWTLNFTVVNTVPGGVAPYITCQDSAGTHPDSPALITVIRYQATVALTKGQKLRAAALGLEEEQAKAIRELEQKLANLQSQLTTQAARPQGYYPTPNWPVSAAQNITFTTTSNGNMPPTTTIGTFNLPDPVPVVVVDPPPQKGEIGQQ